MASFKLTDLALAAGVLREPPAHAGAMPKVECPQLLAFFKRKARP